MKNMAYVKDSLLAVFLRKSKITFFLLGVSGSPDGWFAVLAITGADGDWSKRKVQNKLLNLDPHKR